MRLRIMASRHSAFYSPLISTIAGGFLEREGLEATYSVLGPGQRSHELIRDGVVDIMQSAVSSNWKPLEQGIRPLPVHFAQINQRDGFFLVRRQEASGFEWTDLEGKTLLADHGLQPLVMLRYAVHTNGADWGKINVINAGSPDQMDQAFRRGEGDYIQLQAPAAAALQLEERGQIAVAVGAGVPEVAFSSLCASREFVNTETCSAFLRAYRASRQWVRTTLAEEVAEKQAAFFPEVPPFALQVAVALYQALQCWDGDIEIPRELYDQALNVFDFAGEISMRHPYHYVCVAP